MSTPPSVRRKAIGSTAWLPCVHHKTRASFYKMADDLSIDLFGAVGQKLTKNTQEYPSGKSERKGPQVHETLQMRLQGTNAHLFCAQSVTKTDALLRPFRELNMWRRAGNLGLRRGFSALPRLRPRRKDRIIVNHDSQTPASVSDTSVLPLRLKRSRSTSPCRRSVSGGVLARRIRKTLRAGIGFPHPKIPLILSQGTLGPLIGPQSG